MGSLSGRVMAIRAFQESGLLDGSGDRLLSTDPDAPISSAIVERHKEHASEMLDRMVGYAQTLGCRRSYILEYFGEQPVDGCEHCDNCRSASGSDGSGLAERLIKLRSQIAKRERTDPADVFEDRTAREIADARPRDVSELLEIWGIGPVRVRGYGEELRAAVSRWAVGAGGECLGGLGEGVTADRLGLGLGLPDHQLRDSLAYRQHLRLDVFQGVRDQRVKLVNGDQIAPRQCRFQFREFRLGPR